MTEEDLTLLKKEYLYGSNLTPDKSYATFIVYTDDPGISYVLKELDERHANLYRGLIGEKHPGLASVYEVRKIGDSYFAVTEHLYGETLEDLIEKKGPLSEKQALEYLSMLCDALICIHGKGIVHKDITPGNLILTEDHQLKLIDFGISREIQDKKRNDTQVFGTLGFVAPEVRSAVPSSYTADLYSAGCVLSYLLTGVDPWEKTYHGSPAVEKILDKAMRFDPKERVQSAEELKRMVRRALFDKKGWTAEKKIAAAVLALLLTAGAAAFCVYRKQSSLPSGQEEQQNSSSVENVSEDGGKETASEEMSAEETKEKIQEETQEEIDYFARRFPEPAEDELHYNALGELTDEEERRALFLFTYQPPGDLRPLILSSQNDDIRISALGRTDPENETIISGFYQSFSDESTFHVWMNEENDSLSREYSYVGTSETDFLGQSFVFQLFHSEEGEGYPELYTWGYDLDFYYGEDGTLCFDMISWKTGEVEASFYQKDKYDESRYSL